VNVIPLPAGISCRSGAHRFQQLAKAIGFARWDPDLNEFELADSRVVGFADEDYAEGDVLSHATTSAERRCIELNGQEPMTSSELTNTIDAEGRYVRKDGSR
jgi:hypothetical protein